MELRQSYKYLQKEDLQPYVQGKWRNMIETTHA